MSIEVIRDVLGWCTIINFGLLTLWWLALMVVREPIRTLHVRWFELPREHFDRIHYTALAYFKLGVILFNLTPYLALRIVG